MRPTKHRAIIAVALCQNKVGDTWFTLTVKLENPLYVVQTNLALITLAVLEKHTTLILPDSLATYNI